jgi:polysaccharide pyruvyl transferase WcaK-like protein
MQDNNEVRGRNRNRVNKRPLTFIKLSTQFENVGDCLINRELVRLIAEFSDLVLDVRGCPTEFVDQIIDGLDPNRVKPTHWLFYPKMLLARIQQRRCYWFFTPGGITGNGGSSNAIRSWLTDLPLVLAKFLGVRGCQMGASFSSMSESHLRTWRKRRRYLELFSPRDSQSAQYLESHGISCDPCIPDLAFLIFRQPIQAETEIEASNPIGCFSIRTDQYPEQLGDFLKIMQGMEPRITWRSIFQVGRDEPGMRTIRMELIRKGIAVDELVDLHSNIESSLAYYRTTPFVLSNRLHVLLMAASQGARIMAVVGRKGGEKLEGILNDLGLGEAILRTEDFQPELPFTPQGVKVCGEKNREAIREAFRKLFNDKQMPKSR